MYYFSVFECTRAYSQLSEYGDYIAIEGLDINTLIVNASTFRGYSLNLSILFREGFL